MFLWGRSLNGECGTSTVGGLLTPLEYGMMTRQDQKLASLHLGSKYTLFTFVSSIFDPRTTLAFFTSKKDPRGQLVYSISDDYQTGSCLAILVLLVR